MQSDPVGLERTLFCFLGSPWPEVFLFWSRENEAEG
jgi:hypothetical protein